VIRRIAIGDLTYRVRTVPPGSKGPPDWRPELDGLTDLEGACIYVASQLRGERLTHTIVHEILHAILDASGAGRLLWTLAELQKRDDGEVEEDFVRMVTPMLITALRSARLLRA
jgi:hypothetical protein